MNDRITLISLFNTEDLNKINKVIKNVSEPLCKVPYIKNIDNRISIDTLPYHFTLSAWNIEEKDFVLKKLSNIKFNSFKITVSSIEVMNGRENSYVLYFKIRENRELKKLQERVYNILPVEKYNPNSFEFHITIHVDKDYDKIIKIKKELEQSFIPIELTVSSIGLFEIYPANLVGKHSEQ